MKRKSRQENGERERVTRKRVQRRVKRKSVRTLGGAWLELLGVLG